MAGRGLVKVITALGLLVFALLIVMSCVWNNIGFVPEMIIFIVLILFFYITYDKFNLNLPIFTMVILSFIPHSLGFMGFYANSPLPIAWDHFTHVLPCFAFTLVFFQFIKQFMTKTLTIKNIFLVLLIILAASGIGVGIELFEFSGFLIQGFGEGALAFGPGDACTGQTVTTIAEIDAYGGGWFNTMYDLIWNTIGILTAMALILTNQFLKHFRNLFA